MTRGVPPRRHFRDMIRKTGGSGIAIEKNCAIEFVDGTKFSVQRPMPERIGYIARGEVVSTRVPQMKNLTSIGSLTDFLRVGFDF
jgi:hypothetical protein